MAQRYSRYLTFEYLWFCQEQKKEGNKYVGLTYRHSDSYRSFALTKNSKTASVLHISFIMLTLVLIGEGVESALPSFLFVKTKEKVRRLCTVLNFFLSGGFEDMGIFMYFIYLSFMGRYNPPPSSKYEIREKYPYLQNYH